MQAVAALTGQNRAHGGEVEAEALVPLRPEMLDRLDDHEVEQTVGVVAVVTAHEVE